MKLQGSCWGPWVPELDVPRVAPYATALPNGVAHVDGLSAIDTKKTMHHRDKHLSVINQEDENLVEKSYCRLGCCLVP